MIGGEEAEEAEAEAEEAEAEAEETEEEDISERVCGKSIRKRKCTEERGPRTV
jgi:hypothetical protein